MQNMKKALQCKYAIAIVRESILSLMNSQPQQQQQQTTKRVYYQSKKSTSNLIYH